MDVSSSLSGPKEFRIVKRGYDPDEVDAFLDQIALGVAELKRKLAEAGDAAAAAPAPAPAPAPEPAPAATPAGEGVEEIHRALILAQRAADEEVRKATEEAEGIRAEARSAAEEARSSAEAEAHRARQAVEDEVARRREEGRAGLLSEINELEGIRDSLASDVVVLERHVDEQREVVQAAIGELQSLLDHPEAFRIAVASGVSTEPALPDEPPAPALDDTVAAPTLDDAEEPDADDDDVEVTAEPTDDLQVGPPPEPAAEPVAEAPVEPEPVAAEPVAAEPVAAEALAFPEAAPEPAPAAPEIDLSSTGSDRDVVATPEDDDPGPPTEAMAAVGGADSEDAFLAELRKAMLDDEPLGPREDADLRPLPADPDDEPGRGRTRFGRRK